MEERQRCHITFAGTLDIVCAFVDEDLHRQEPRCVVRRLDIMPPTKTHLVQHISKLLRLPSLTFLVPSLVLMEKSAQICGT